MLLFLFASLVLVNTTAIAKTNTDEANTSILSNVRGYGNSFIFNEAGIEFSVFADGQFDFFIPNYGPDVSVGFNSPGFALSFNSGFNYNPYVQYDSFGAIIQIENTPIFYDFYGRVNQVGNIVVNYNGFGRVNRIGGLNIHYRNNVFWRYDGFINSYNRAYAWRPWHRFYAVPHVNFCIVNVHPYRRFYAPVRHTFYRPYRNNVRHFNVNTGRRGYADTGRRHSATRTSNRYAQSPRNARERSVRQTVERTNRDLIKNRTARLNESNLTGRSRGHGVAEASARGSHMRGTDDARRTRANTNLKVSKSRNDKAIATRYNSRTTSVAPPINRTKDVTRTLSSVSHKNESKRTNSLRKPNTTKSRTYTRSKSRSNKERNTIQNKRKSSSVTNRSATSRKHNQSSTRSNSRRSKG